jgi:hypothetical protein
MIDQLVHSELARIKDSATLSAISQWLVDPRCEQREWDYCDDGRSYPCWIVLEHPPSNTCIVYCEQGFGPSCPWGLVFIAGEHLSMGADYSWCSSLEEAFVESMAWDSDMGQ